MLKIWQKLWREHLTQPLFWRYILSGLLTTYVNSRIFAGLGSAYGFQRWFWSNSLAIFLSILFAFVLNRYFVFRSRAPIIPEFTKFVVSRTLISLFFENFCFYLLYDLLAFRAALHWSNLSLPWAKLLAQVGVVFGNYIVGKIFVFKSKVDNAPPEA